jgi:hypothetical protein
LIVRYGLNKQDGIELRKTEDVLQLSSALGYRKDTLSGSILQISISLPNSQMDMRIQIRIFQYPDHLHPYIFLGLGAEYASKTNTTFTYLLLLPNNNGIRPEVS